MGWILLRAGIAIVALGEAASLLIGAALHAGLPVPAPFREPVYLPSAVLEAVAGALLLYAVWTVARRPSRAWPTAVTAHAMGVAAIVFGIGARVTGRTPRLAGEAGHHPRTLLVLIVVLLGLALPPVRAVLEGRRGRKRRRRHRRRGSSPASPA
jgi:hypothetical protein